MNDHIHIDQLEVLAHIGVPDVERASPQRLILNITFWPIHGAELADDIGRTVDYSAVCAKAKTFVEARADRLIETLADELASHLLAVFEMQKIAIEIRKFVLPDVKFVSVSVTRTRAAPRPQSPNPKPRSPKKP